MRHGRPHPPALGFILAAFLGVTVAATAQAGTGSGTTCAGETSGGRSTVTLPPGSNLLAGAIAAVEPGGTIVLLPGRHRESGTVVIDKPLTLQGSPGAELEVKTSPSSRYPLWIDAALSIMGTSHVQVQGITLRPRHRLGGAAILIDGSDAVSVSDNRLLDHQFGVVVERGAGASIARNAIVAGRRSGDWTPSETYGVMIVSGRDARIERNTIADATYGIWVSDRDGRATGNVVLGSFGGIALGKIPADRFLIAGDRTGSTTVATGWSVRGNLSSGNTHGYLLRDGASGIDLADNLSSATGLYDVEVTCDDAQYGFVTLQSFEAWMSREGEGELVAKGCGEEPLISRGGLAAKPNRAIAARVGL
jgi:nitrous oxidase accessory protein NosD